MYSFSRLVKTSRRSQLALLSAHKAAEISLYKLKDYKKAIEFFVFIVLYSQDAENISKAQENIGMIYFNKLNDYRKAIEVFSHLIPFSKDEEKAFFYKILIIRSYYYLRNFFQAKVEANLLLKETSLNHYQVFEVKLLKAHILLAIKKVREALHYFQQLERTYPDWSEREKIGMSIVICHEELQEYDEAIKKLSSMRSLYPDPRFIDDQLEKLKQRRSNMPGYHGLRGLKRSARMGEISYGKK